MDSKNKIKSHVYEQMARAGIDSRKELARQAGMAPWRVGAYVNGKIKRIDLVSLGKLCRVLGCQPGDLYTYEC